MSQKFTSTIAGASIFISVIGLLSRGLGFIREMIFANNFGLETDFDLYLVGAVLPITINSIILYIGQNYFIPEFHKMNTLSQPEAQKFFKFSFITFSVTGIFLAIILFLSDEIIIKVYMHSASLKDQEAAIKVFNIFLITIPFSASISVLSSFLQSVYEFKYPAFSLLFLNVSVILMLLLLSDRFGVYIIPVGYLIGTILQFGYLMIKSSKHYRLNLFKNDWELKLTKSFLNSSIVVIILIEGISQLNAILDRYFYSEITSGGIASLNYAMIIWFLPVSIFSMSLATAVFPIITKAINDESYEDLERIYNESISINVFLFIPMSFILFFYGDTLIRLFFERGKFLPESTAITFSVLQYYSLSLAFYSAYAVFNKIFYSINQSKILLIITISGVLIKLSLNYLLLDFHQDGLALSTTLSFIFFFVASHVILNNKLKIKDKFLFSKDFIFHLINCILCFLIVTIFIEEFQINGLLGDIARILFFVIFYSVNLFILKHNSIEITKKVIEHINFSNKFKFKY